MAFCAGDANATIGKTNFTWAQALANLQDGFPNSSYIRPTSGGALLPWIYTVIVIVFHIPTVIIRVVRWELVQIWSLVFTFFTVIVYIQAFVSSRFDAAQILVWTPIILVIDAGSMLQVFFLIIEAEKLQVAGRDIIIDPPDAHANGDPEVHLRVQGFVPTATATEACLSSSLLSRIRTSLYRKEATTPERVINDSLQRNRMNESFSDDNAIAAKRRRHEATTIKSRFCWDRRVWIAVFAFVLLMAVFTLQILGLAKAISAVSSSSGPPIVQWCSTLFQPFGVAAVDGDCSVYQITESSSTGIGGFGGVGCISVRGVWQQSWLMGTVAGLAVELLAEIGDFTILLLVSNTFRWKGVKMRRPWISIFSGMVVLLATLICGVFYATNLPPGVTGRMMVLMETPAKAAYMVNLTSEGLKGNINSWNDGIFYSWRGIYFGD